MNAKNATTPFAQKLREVIDEDFDGNVHSFAKECKRVAGKDEAPSESLIHKYLGSTWPRLDKLIWIAKAAERSVSFFTDPPRLDSEQAAYEAEYFQNRDVAKLGSYFESAHSRIDILTTSLSFFSDMYVRNRDDGEVENVSNLHAIEIALKRAQEKGDVKFSARICVLDPESYVAQLRGDQLGHANRTGAFRQKLRKSLFNAIRLQRKYPSLLTVRVYDQFISQILYRIDSNLFLNFIPANRMARTSATIKIDRFLPGVGSSFIAHFDQLWTLANEPDPFISNYFEGRQNH